MDATELSDLLVEHLREHRAAGGKKCVKGKALARLFNTSERMIRAAVEDARNRGELIGSGGDGYFYAVHPAEMIPVLVNLEKRALSILHTRRMIREKLRAMKTGPVQLELLEREDTMRRSA